MARVRGKIEIDEASFKEATKLLEQVGESARNAEITRALRNAGNLIKNEARNRLPKPGYPGDVEGLKPLRDMISVKITSYQDGSIKVATTGYSMAAHHGHLVEDGHEKWLWGEHIENSPVDPYPYIEESVEATKGTVAQSLIESARRSFNRALAKGGK